MDNYRYQFNSIITKDGYEDLYGRMARKLAELKSKRREPLAPPTTLPVISPEKDTKKVEVKK